MSPSIGHSAVNMAFSVLTVVTTNGAIEIFMSCCSTGLGLWMHGMKNQNCTFSNLKLQLPTNGMLCILWRIQSADYHCPR